MRRVWIWSCVVVVGSVAGRFLITLHCIEHRCRSWTWCCGSLFWRWHSSPFCSFLRWWQLACHLHLTHLGWALVLVGAWLVFLIGILWQNDFDSHIYDSWLHRRDILVEGGAAPRSSHIVLIWLFLLMGVICWQFGVVSSLRAPLLCHQYRLLCVELLPTLVTSGWTWPHQHGIYLGLLPVSGLLSWVNETLFCRWWYRTRGGHLLGFRWGPRTHMSWLCYVDLLRIRQWFYLVLVPCIEYVSFPCDVLSWSAVGFKLL